MAERENQNWERRVIDSFGPKYSIDVNNPQMGEMVQMFFYKEPLLIMRLDNFLHWMSLENTCCIMRVILK